MARRKLIWSNLAVLSLTPIAAVTAVPIYGYFVGYDLFEGAIFAFFMVATGLSITAGYHRLWSHRSYDAHCFVRAFFAFFGACALQNSILHWVSDHRRHHNFVDRNDRDPYSRRRGFWFSHIGWILLEGPSGKDDFSNVGDLLRDPIARFQHRHYLLLAVVSNVVLSLGLGLWHGKLFGVFLLASVLRLVLNHHFTFFINSLAHTWGKQPYVTSNTSRDNCVLAFLTYGEGYHNFHHRFQFDYRNGVRWWQFDPTKWFIRLCALLGLTRKLRRATRLDLEKAKMDNVFQRALKKCSNSADLEEWRPLLEKAYRDFLEAWKAWLQFKADRFSESNRVMWKIRRLELKLNLKLHRTRWRILIAQLA